MDASLSQAFAEISKLPLEEQRRFAAWIMEELAAETRWAKVFTESQRELEAMAQNALTEHRSGQTTVLNRLTCRL